MNSKIAELYLSIKSQYLDAHASFRESNLNANTQSLGDKWHSFIEPIIKAVSLLSKEKHKELIIYSRDHINTNYIQLNMLNEDYNQCQNLHELLVREYAHKI